MKGIILFGALIAALTSAPALAQQLTPPVPLEQLPPEWPASQPELHDVVVPVVIEVAADGSVTSVEVEVPVSPAFDAKAIEAAQKWTFAPAMRDGVAVAARVRAIVRFRAPVAPPPADRKPGAVPPAEPLPATHLPPPKPVPPVEIRVQGERRGPAPTGASDFAIRPGQLHDVPRGSAEQLLTLAPGFALSNHGGRLHPSAIFLRGFDAAEGQDLEFSLGGVPLNDVSNAHSHGFADTHFIIPELVSELRVIEGPFDPRQADFAVAGSAAFDVALGQRGISAKGEYGSYDTRKLTLLWGPKHERPQTFVGAQAEQSSGFGPNRAHRAARLMVGYEHPLSDQAALQLAAQSYAGAFDSAGVLRRDDFEARRLSRCPKDEESQFFCLYDPNQGGGTVRHAVAAKLSKNEEHTALSLQLFAALRQLRSRENFTGFVTDFQATGDAQRGDGVEQVYHATTFGSRGSYALRPRLWRHQQELELGYFFRYDDGTSQQRRLRRRGGEPYKIDFDNRLRISNLAAYAAGKLRPFPRLILRGGARFDSFSFAVADRNRPASDRQGTRLTTDYAEAFGFAFQPRASAEVLLGSGMSALCSYGVGVRSSDAQALSDGEFAPFARVQAFDVGLVGRRDHASALTYDSRAVVFFTRVDRDLLFDETSGRNVFVGASSRIGGLLYGRVTHRSGLDVAGSATYAEAFLARDDDDLLQLSGERLPYVPRWVARLDASLRQPWRVLGQRGRWSAALGAGYIAGRPLPLNELGEPVFTTDIAASVGYRFIEVGLQVTNVFDARYHEAELNYASNFAGPDVPTSQLAADHFAAGAPRMWLASLELTL